jgi:hypothetical protein
MKYQDMALLLDGFLSDQYKVCPSTHQTLAIPDDLSTY